MNLWQNSNLRREFHWSQSCDIIKLHLAVKNHLCSEPWTARREYYVTSLPIGQRKMCGETILHLSLHTALRKAYPECVYNWWLLSVCLFVCLSLSPSLPHSSPPAPPSLFVSFFFFFLFSAHFHCPCILSFIHLLAHDVSPVVWKSTGTQALFVSYSFRVCFITGK